MWEYVHSDELYHHGVKGMKWGVRKYDKKAQILSARAKGNRIKKALKDPKTSVKNYSKKYDDWEKTQNAADKQWKEAKELRKSLGKTSITRAIRAAKGKTAEAKAYNKKYDEWSKTQELADKKLSEVKEAYSRTGRNAVSRIINNFKYDR